MSDSKVSIVISAKDSASPALGKVRAGVKSISEQLDSMRAQVTRVTAAWIGLGQLRELAALSDQWAMTNARIKLATQSSQEYAAAQAAVFDISQRTQADVRSTAELYTKLQTALRGMGGSQAQAIALTQATAQAIKLSGASTEAATAAITQFGQALASGVLRGDELNSIMEQAPRLAQAIAQGLGITIGQLRGLGEQGKLTADQVAQALLSQRQTLDAEFASLPVTLSGSLTRLQNAWAQYIGTQQQVGSAVHGVSEVVNTLSANLATLAETAARAGLVIGTIWTATKLRDLAAWTQAQLASTLAQRAATAAAVLDAQAKVVQTDAVRLHAAMLVAEAEAAVASAGGMARLNLVQTTLLPARARLTAATAAHTAALAAEAAAANTTRASLLSIGNAINVVAAAVAGYQIGSWLYDQFETARIAGAALAAAVLKIGAAVKGAFTLDFASIKSEWKRIDREMGDALIAAEAERRRQTQQKPPTPQGSMSAPLKATVTTNNPAQDTSGARLALIRAQADAEFALLNDGLKRAQTAYDAALRQRLISIKGYYAAQTAIEQQGIDAEIARNQKQLAAQQAQATGGKTENDRLRARAEVAKIEADLIVLNNKRSDVETANAAKASQAERDLAQALSKTREELAQLTGTATAADRRAAIANQYADLRRQLEADGQGTALIDHLIDVKAAQANLDALQGKWQRTLQAMRDAQQAVSLQQQAGLLTPAQATAQTAAIQQQGAGELQGLLPGMEAAANAIGPEQVAHIQAWRNELTQAQQVADQMAPVWNDIGSTFSSALQGMVQGTQTWAQAVGSLFKGVSDAFLKYVVIDPFQEWVAQQAKMLAMKLGFSQQEQAMNTATAAQTVAAKTAETTTVVSANAAQAGSGAASALAAIPYVGPALAVAGMASMVAAVMALLGKGFATGGLVRGPGTGTSDSIPARLSAGEYVVRAAAVRSIGTGALDAINGLKRPPTVVSGRMAFAAGGLVPAASSAAGTQPQAPGVRIVNAIDPSITADFMNSPAGEKVVLNIISRNPRAVRAAME